MNRAVLVNGVVLAVVMALASTVANGRRDITLGDVVQPEGWRIAFRPPVSWEPVAQRRGIFTDFLVFDYQEAPSASGISAPMRRLHARRMSVRPTDAPTDVAVSCLQGFDVATGSGRLGGMRRGGTLRSGSCEFGATEGVTVETEIGVIVSAGIVGGEGYCFAVESAMGVVRDYDRSALSAICESVDEER